MRTFGQAGDILDSRTESLCALCGCPDCPEPMDDYHSRRDPFGGDYQPAHDDCLTPERLRADLRQLSYYSGIRTYPYEEGIEGLRTTLVNTLNTIADLITLLERGAYGRPSRTMQDQDSGS